MEYSKRKFVIIAVIALVCLGLLLALILNLDNIFNGEGFFSGISATESQKKLQTVYIDNVPYLPRKEVVNFLVMGLDEEGYAEGEGRAQVDFLLLISFNKEDQTYKMYQIDRDTMAEVDTYNNRGEKIGTKTEQIALSYAYGDNKTISNPQKANNTIKSVSKLFYGLKIHHYVAITMSGTAELVDALGGINIVVKDDMTAINELFVHGEEVMLDGKLALQYIRARGGLDVPTNIARMARQRDFLSVVIEKLASTELDTGNALSIYSSIEEYTFTGCDDDCFSELFGYLNDYSSLGIVSLEGESVRGEKFMEFYIDENVMKGLVTNVFFEKAK